MKKGKCLLTTGTILTLIPSSIGFMSMENRAETKFSGEKNRPNILFIVSEDTGQELGCYGAPVKTPNLDKLATNGVRFQNAFVTQSGCSPSRASFLTGLYPHQNGQVGLATSPYSMYREKTPNMVNVLKNSGYRTGMIGKVHVNPESAFNFDWWEFQGSNFQRKDLSRYSKMAYNFIMESEAPFFLQVNYPDAHVPFLSRVDGRPVNPLKGTEVDVIPYFGISSDSLKQKTADYYNCIMRLDEWIGELIKMLKKTGKYENTMIVYIGDHGADMLRGKRTCYEGAVKIPLIMSWVGGKDNIVNDQLVSTIDLFPTFLELAGLPVPSYLPGKSLMNIINGNQAPIREYLFTEYNVQSNDNPYPQRSIRNDEFKLIHNLVSGNKNPGIAYTLGKKIDEDDYYKALANAPANIREAYLRMENPPEYELYNLKNDPYEWDNLAEDSRYSKIFTELKEELRNWQVDTKDPFIDKKVAERFFNEVMKTGGKKTPLKYHEYMDPHLDFK